MHACCVRIFHPPERVLGQHMTGAHPRRRISFFPSKATAATIGRCPLSVIVRHRSDVNVVSIRQTRACAEMPLIRPVPCPVQVILPPQDGSHTRRVWRPSLREPSFNGKKGRERASACLGPRLPSEDHLLTRAQKCDTRAQEGRLCRQGHYVGRISITHPQGNDPSHLSTHRSQAVAVSVFGFIHSLVVETFNKHLTEPSITGTYPSSHATGASRSPSTCQRSCSEPAHRPNIRAFHMSIG